jgi:hypothetical protein
MAARAEPEVVGSIPAASWPEFMGPLSNIRPVKRFIQLAPLARAAVGREQSGKTEDTDRDKTMRSIALITTVILASIGCAHKQRPEPRIYVISETAQGIGSSLGTGGAGLRNCDDEHIQCFDECWNANPLPWPYTRRDGWFHEYCTRECRKKYVECEKENEKRARELKFSRVDEAIDWIRTHKAEVALGMVVIIAGTAFVITTGGTGALILAPLAL